MLQYRGAQSGWSWTLLAAALAVLATPLYAQDHTPSENPETAMSRPTGSWMPYGECRSGYWSSSRNLDDDRDYSASNCLLNWKAKATEHLRFGANVRLLHAANADQSQFNGRVREGYLLADIGPLTFKLGRQIVVWGRSDRVSPTDVLSSRDFTARVSDSDEQRNGNDMASVAWQLNEKTTLTAVVGRFEANRMPNGSLPVNRSTWSPKIRSDIALKLDRSGAGLDWSLSYFDGLDKTPRYRFLPGPAGGVFEGSHERMRMLGTDFAGSTGRWTFRGEAAWFQMTADCPGCSLSSRKIQRAVVGVDRDFLTTANLNLQAFIIRRTDYVDPQTLAANQQALAAGLNRLNSEYAGFERGATLRFSERFLNETLKVEVSGIFDLTQSSRVTQARLSYAINDRLKVQAGVDHFQGQAQSFFGSRIKNNLAFVELAWVF
jgi:hypothetical protein